MSDKKIKIAQIGVGYWGPNLLRNLMQNDDCQVEIVVDLSKERREFVKNLYPSLLVSDDLSRIIDNNEIEAVVISTPVSTHFDLAIKCLKSRKNILVEKPMAMNTEEVQKIGELSKANNLISMVGHTFLFNSAVRYIKRLIKNNELGDVRYIYSQRLNLGRIRNDVDALWNLAPHDISIIQYWLDDIDPISKLKFGQSYVQKGIDDVVFLNIKYPNDIMANIHVSWLDPRKTRKMTIVGSKKMLVYDDIADKKIMIYDKGIDRMAILGKHMDFDDPSSFYFNHRSGEVVIPKIDWVEPLKEELAHFINCIKGKDKCISDHVHARKVVEILS
tara:strand:- start:20357 stop:21349 length:993 start_codon:yes stop_codon:yes gene_type:complete